MLVWLGIFQLFCVIRISGKANIFLDKAAVGSCRILVLWPLPCERPLSVWILITLQPCGPHILCVLVNQNPVGHHTQTDCVDSRHIAFELHLYAECTCCAKRIFAESHVFPFISDWFSPQKSCSIFPMTNFVCRLKQNPLKSQWLLAGSRSLIHTDPLSAGCFHFSYLSQVLL